NGTHFYAMELVEGPSLNVVVKALREGATERRGGEGAKRRSDGGAEPRASARADIRPPAQSQELPGTETESTVTTPLLAWVAETIAGEATPAPASTTESTGSGSSTTLTTGGGYFDNVARMMAEVADGLDYAHNQGVIHRDIKPSNLLLSPAGRLSINDFGLARMLEQPGMTMTGEFVGSPLYMSPEQITAGRAPLDHRTDIYSLGATLYELLTLQPPFPGNRRDQIIAQIISKEPKPPRRHNKRVPVDLETICLKAMEKDPDRRYQTAGQMAEDVRRFVNRFAISAKRAGPVTRTIKWVRRHPAVAGLLGVVIVISAIASLLAYRSHLAQEAARAAEGQRALDQATVAALCGHYDQVEPWLQKAEVLDVDAGRILVLRGLADVERGNVQKAIQELESAIQQHPSSLGAHALLSRAYLEAGLFEKNAILYGKMVTLQPVTPEDYLYGGWALWPFKTDLARSWLTQLAAEHPTPAVHYVLGLYLTIELMESYEPADGDRTLAHTGAARTQMPDNVRAIWFDGMAHLVVADIHKLHDEPKLHQLHLDKATATARLLLSEHGGDGMAVLLNAYVADYEGRPDEALIHFRNAIDLPGFWPKSRPCLPLSLCHQGRYEEALTELEAMPAGLKAASNWGRDHTFVTGFLAGADAAEAAYQSWLNTYADYAHRDQQYWVYCFLGRRQDAIELTRQRFEKIRRPSTRTDLQTAWDRYTCGELSDEALLAAVDSRRNWINAHEIIGQTQLAEGNRAAAMKHFAEVQRAGHYVCSWYQSMWAWLQLQRLREDPTWPPWIPVRGEAQTQPATRPSTSDE
ncbi:MAG: protein kinase, partial [Phycisphaerales bacterium]